jgi:hypothetical protein
MTSPICDACPAQHVTIGAGDHYIVKCSLKGERHAPMVDAACDRKPAQKYLWPVAKPVARNPICPKCGIDERTVTVASACDCEETDGGK